MATIATAEVQLIPSLRGGAATIAKELGGTKAGELAGKDIALAMTPQLAAAAAKAGDSFAARFGGTKAGELAGKEIGGGLEPAVATASAKAGESVRAALTEAGVIGGDEGGLKAGEGLRAGIVGGLRGIGGKLGGAAGLAGREAGEVAGAEAGASFGERFLDTAKDLAAPLLAYFGAEKVVEFFKSSVEAGESAETTGKLIEIQMRNTGAAAGISLQTVDKLATSVGNSAGIAREQILESEQALLKFANIGNSSGTGNDVFSRATQDATDLAAVMKTDVPTAAALLGKALNNPTAGLSRLTRAGVAFSAQQLAQIKAMVASGNQLGAQKIILDQFEKQFSGAAASSATAADRFRASVSNLKDEVGTALLPMISAAEDGLAKLGTQAAETAQDDLSKVGATFDALKANNDADLAKALGVGPDSPVIAGLDELRDLVGKTYHDVVADLVAVEPGVEAAVKGFGGLAVELGGETLAGVDAVAKGLHPLAEALSATLGFLGSHANVFAGPVTGLLALAAAIKGVKLASSGFNAVTSIGSNITKSLAPARQAMAELTYSSGKLGSTIGQIGSAALSPAGLAGIGVAVAGAGLIIDGLVKHYEAGKQQVKDFTQALIDDNDEIGASTKASAVNQLTQSGALATAQKLGISVGLVTQATLGSIPAQKELATQLSAVEDAGNGANSAAGAQVKTAGQLNVAQSESQASAYGLSRTVQQLSGSFGQSTAAAKLTAEGYESLGLNADGSAKSTDKVTTATHKAAIEVGSLNGLQRESAVAAALLAPKQAALADDTAKLRTATAGLNAELQDMETNYFAIGDAKDAFQSALNAAVQSFSDSKTGAIGTSDAAIGARASLEGMVDATDKLITADNNHHYSAARIKADYDDQRAALVKFVDAQEKAGKLTTEQGDYYLNAQAHIPAAIGTLGAQQVKVAQDKAAKLLQQKQNHLAWYAEIHTPGAEVAAAKTRLINDRLKSMPKGVDVALYAQGTKSMLGDLGAVRTAVNQIPKSVEISLGLNAAAYEKQLLALEKAGASPVFAAQSLKNRMSVPHFATGGPVSGPGGPTSDDILADLSNGEDVVNAAAYARNRRAVDAMNAGATIGAAGSGAVHVRVFIGSRELTDIVRTEVDSSSSDVAGYVRYRAA